MPVDFIEHYGDRLQRLHKALKLHDILIAAVVLFQRVAQTLQRLFRRLRQRPRLRLPRDIEPLPFGHDREQPLAKNLSGANFGNSSYGIESNEDSSSWKL